MSKAMNANGAIAPLNDQQVYDFALFGLRKQGTRGIMGKNNVCAYRTPEGNACGIGQALPDSIDIASVDSLGDSSIDVVLAYDTSDCPAASQFSVLFSNCALGMLRDLQETHDTSAGIDSAWEAKMKDIAETYALVYTPRETV